VEGEGEVGGGQKTLFLKIKIHNGHNCIHVVQGNQRSIYSIISPAFEVE